MRCLTRHGVHVFFCLVLVTPACTDEANNPFEEPDAQTDDGDGGGGEDAGDQGDQIDEGDGDISWPERDLDPTCRGLLELEGEELRQALRDLVIGHDSLSYDSAREEMFAGIDNHNGQVQCVYTGQWVTTDGIPPTSVMNTEHTWCQSWGADVLPAKSDLNHLYPATSDANVHRSNNLFGEVVEPTWESGGSILGRDAIGRTVFEPRDQHKGDCARAMFYFAIRYDMEIVYASMESALRSWNRRDLPDEKEMERNDAIELVQSKRNPFIDCPEVVDKIPDF
jgi:deoxyribonuclease-1